MKTILGVIAALILSGWTSVANASLIGQEITITETRGSLLNPTPRGVASLTVPGDPTLQINLGLFNVLFLDGETIRISSTGVGNPDFGIIFGNLSWGAIAGGITGISLTPSVNFGNLLVESAFTSNSVSLFFGDDSAADEWIGGEYVDLSLIVSHTTVPVPATLALFGLGLACLTMTRRKSAR